MKLEDQVCSLELAKKLKELGVPQSGAFDYYENTFQPENPFIVLKPTLETGPNWICSAFTVAELGNLLGRNVNDISWHRLGWREWIDIAKEAYHETEADARASRLIHLIGAGIVKL